MILMKCHQVAQASNFFTLGGPAFVTTFAAFAAKILAVMADHVTVGDYILQPDQSSITSNSANVQLLVDFSVTPADSFSTPEVRQLFHKCSSDMCMLSPCEPVQRGPAWCSMSTRTVGSMLQSILSTTSDFRDAHAGKRLHRHGV